MYIQLISIHGLIRGERIEMGRDSDTGGQVRYVIDLARTLGEMDGVSQVDLFTRRIRDKRVESDYGEEIEKLGPRTRIVRLPCGGPRYIRKERLWPYLDDFADAMITFTRKEGKLPTLVHGHYADAGYIANAVSSAFGVPFVFTGHSLGRDKKSYLESQGMPEEHINREYNMHLRIDAEEKALSSADLVVTSTRHERDVQYKRYYNGKDPRFAVIPPGTALERFFPYYEYEVAPDNIQERWKQARMRMQAELDRFHYNNDRPVILALCRPDKRKNINALVEAYGQDKELQALANLAIFAGIRRSITDLPDAEQAVLTDMLLMMDRYDLYGKMAVPKKHESEIDVPEMYRLAAAKRGVFVNCAFVEPFGLTYIEAAACGLPFVGTENGGPQDIVENCECGILVDVNKPAEIGKAIKAILTDRDRWQRFSDNGVNRVRQHYSWQKHCLDYLKAVGEIVNATPKSTIFLKYGNDAPGRRLADVEALLLTDIDNTLLGDDESMQRLLALLKDHRGRIGFGVASGRYKDMVLDVLEEHGIDELDVIISSVGAEIYYGRDLVPDKGWASHLRSKWRPDRVRDALDKLPFLTIQTDENTQREFKVSYDLDKDTPADEALPRIHDALGRCGVPHTVIFSHGVYVDVLPLRASKGKAVRYLSNKWNIPIERIATAGDSGNDADMLKGRTSGIAVGNYAEELEPLRRDTSRIYFAKAEYAAGIIEGLRHYGLLPRE
ncbi:MAG: HAD-IIB family hydrolase [Candidatus Hydrogenedentes bacterium]|nr:HAD-IIB family hydrolase [Candidatus Hydrogenedentota bacterium]